MKFNRFLVLLLLLFLAGNIFAVIDLLGLQANVYQSGSPLDSGNVSVFIYAAASGGTLLWNQSYIRGIVNGTYDILLGSNDTNNLSLNYGQVYYLDIKINDVDQNFSGIDRQQFQSSVGNLTLSKGATGLTTYSTGDLLYALSANVLDRLTIGATNQLLIASSNGFPAWASAAAFLNNSHSHDAANITGTIATSQINLGGLNNTHTLASANITGTIATSQINLGGLNNTHTHTPVNTSVYDSAGLRMNDISTTDFDAGATTGSGGGTQGYMVFGDNAAATCANICFAHGLDCGFAFNLTSATDLGCNGNTGTVKYCWCGS